MARPIELAGVCLTAAGLGCGLGWAGWAVLVLQPATPVFCGCIWMDVPGSAVQPNVAWRPVRSRCHTLSVEGSLSGRPRYYGQPLGLPPVACLHCTVTVCINGEAEVDLG
ncbi:hypothetical protein BHE90_001222 [Fusarium euwallaceae]|uniref:Uncharacterized protein n=1 Tax=Fusarium euwallaceae TaxID=1147111 RepID=A0A430M864_9HYPO|nr:hypothetical protein BHE90_001222 [Fusarium euwallaceae]